MSNLKGLVKEYIKVLVKEKRPLTQNEVKRIAFYKAKKKLGFNPNKTFIEGMKIVQRIWTPLGHIVIVEVPGDKWRRWLPEKRLKS